MGRQTFHAPFLTCVAICSAISSAALSADRLPLVINGGQVQQLQSGDTLTVFNLQDTGLTASSIVCTDASRNLVSSGCGGGGGPSPGNPTASIGLSVINGSATTYMRSDAAPPLNQAIVPTWTGAHTFNVAPTLASITGTANNCLQVNTSGLVSGTGAQCGPSTNQNTRSITFIISGGGSTIATGVQGFVRVPFACTISDVTLIANATGSIVIDIWKHAYVLNTPPTVANTITASDLPTLSSAQTYDDTTLTGWTTSVVAGDVIAYNVNSATTVTQVTVSLACVATS